MPYSKIEDLPDAVKKKFSSKQQAQYLAVWNETYKRMIAGGMQAKKAEERAFKTAWGVAAGNMDKSLFFEGLIYGIDEFSMKIEPLLKVMQDETQKPLKHLNYKGIPIVIEYEAGETRPDLDSSTPRGEWTVGPNWDYGYILETASNEVGDELDCYLGKFENDEVYLAYVKRPDGGFDEVKVMIGFIDQGDAKKALKFQYDQVCPRPDPEMVTMMIPDFLTTLEQGKLALGRTSPNTAIVVEGDPEPREEPMDEELDEVNYRGIPIVIEHNGLADYGYVENDTGDREQAMNVCLGAGPADSDKVHMMYLASGEGGIDGAIAFLGFENADAAKEAFVHQFPESRFLMDTVIGLDVFKKFLMDNKLMSAIGPEVMEMSTSFPATRTTEDLISNPPLWMDDSLREEWMMKVAESGTRSYVESLELLRLSVEDPQIVLEEFPVQRAPEEILAKVEEKSMESPEVSVVPIQGGSGVQLIEHVTLDNGVSEPLLKMIQSLTEKMDKLEARPTKISRRIERDKRGLVTRIVEEEDDQQSSVS